MTKLFIVLIGALGLVLAVPSSYARDERGRGYSEQESSDHRRHGHERDDRDECDDERDDDRGPRGKSGREHHDDDRDSCTPTIPTPGPTTPPTTTAANFLTILPAVPSTTSINNSLGNVSRFYTPAAWAVVVTARASHGAVVATAQASTKTQDDIFGIKGKFNVITYTTRFADGSVWIESVGMEQGADGVWRVAYYGLEQNGLVDNALELY